MPINNFYPEMQGQSPDLLGSYVRGALAPGAIQEQQQGLQEGSLRLDMLRQAMAKNAFMTQLGEQMATGAGGQPAPSGGVNGGIQSGPQDGVAGGETSPMGYGVSPNIQRGLAVLEGKYGPDTEKAIMDNQVQQMQLHAAGPMALAESVITSPNPAALIMNNPSLMQGWQQFAPKLGVNPSDPRAMTPENVRAAATLYYNNIAGAAKLPPKAMPAQLRNVYGPGGQIIQVNDADGGKATEVTGQKFPTYSMQERYDETTGKKSGILVQTSPGGQTVNLGGASPAPAGGVRGGGGGLGSQNGQTVDLGYAPPNAENNKATMFAREFKGGNQTMSAMEAKGFQLSPSARTLAINMATDEDPGMMRQLMSQEIAAHKLSPDDQTYLAAMMPMLQAAGHDQSGARLTTAQIRQNVESLLPMGDRNAANLAQVRANREGFYQGLLQQAGGANLHAPQNRDLLADHQRAAAPPQAPATALAYLRDHPESAQHFKAKYGYLP